MARLLYILSGCAFLAACWVFAAWAGLRRGADERRDWIRDLPSVVQLYQERFAERGRPAKERTPPLVAQAQAFASRLGPPSQAATERPEKPSSTTRDVVVPRIPRSVSVKFRLLGTSYYPNQPERSMALISELGRPDGRRKWVKEGSQLSHFVLHEIRRGAIVLHDGNDLREMTVEHHGTRPGLVRDVWSGSRKVSTATGHGASVPAGPNGVEANGGD